MYDAYVFFSATANDHDRLQELHKAGLVRAFAPLVSGGTHDTYAAVTSESGDGLHSALNELRAIGRGHYAVLAMTPHIPPLPRPTGIRPKIVVAFVHAQVVHGTSHDALAKAIVEAGADAATRTAGMPPGALIEVTGTEAEVFEKLEALAGVRGLVHADTYVALGSHSHGFGTTR